MTRLYWCSAYAMSALMWYCAVPARVPGGGLLARDRPPGVERAAVADLARAAARGLEHPAAEGEHLPRPLRARVREERDDVDLRVPEVVALVAAAGHALGRDAVALAARGGLHEREEVEADRLLDAGRSGDLDVRALPERRDVRRVLGLDRVEAVGGGAVERPRDVPGVIARTRPSGRRAACRAGAGGPGARSASTVSAAASPAAAALVTRPLVTRCSMPHASSSPLLRVASRSTARVPSAAAAERDQRLLREAAPAPRVVRAAARRRRDELGGDRHTHRPVERLDLVPDRGDVPPLQRREPPGAHEQPAAARRLELRLAAEHARAQVEHPLVAEDPRGRRGRPARRRRTAGGRCRRSRRPASARSARGRTRPPG